MAQPPKGAASHLRTQLESGIPKKSSKTPREYRCATFLWQELQTQAKPKNEWRIPKKGWESQSLRNIVLN